MSDIMHDRNYYRMLDDDDLIALARENPTSDLALELADRLELEMTLNRKDDD